MKVDLAMGGFGFKVWGNIINSEGHTISR